ncbi:hypothetical protein N9251_03055 [Gammaproteobacteria bacterium]|nr:hypothetical protein [Gammaproteobacteria bacterium]
MKKTKNCTGCKKDKPLTEFGKDKQRKDNLTIYCRSCTCARSRKYYIANREAVIERVAQYYQDNRDAKNAYDRQYYADNKEARIEWQVQYQRERLNTDPAYKLVCYMRIYMNQILKGIGKHAPTLELLGCSPEEFRDHLESQFTEGMSWLNHGEWHMDHIIPCAAFDQTDPEHQKQCWHWSNYQPLWAFDNISKGDKILPEHADKLPTNLL